MQLSDCAQNASNLGPSGLYLRMLPNAMVVLSNLSKKWAKGLARICSDFSNAICF